MEIQDYLQFCDIIKDEFMLCLLQNRNNYPELFPFGKDVHHFDLKLCSSFSRQQKTVNNIEFEGLHDENACYLHSLDVNWL